MSLPPLRLKGPLLGRFRDLLQGAFSRARFAELLLTRLNKRIGDHSSPADFDSIAFLNVLVEANAQLWWQDLLREARNASPSDPALQAFAEELGLAPQALAVDKQGARTVVRGSALQTQIKKAQSTFDILTWRKRLGEIESRVCRIELPEKTGIGTGFLVSPIHVLTNYHVIEPLLDTPALAKDVVVRFDYKVLEDGVSVGAGKTYQLAANWLVAQAPYSEHDEEVQSTGEPTTDELDFALLELDGTPGDDPVGGDTDDPNAVARRWLVVRPTNYDFLVNKSIYIVQHPDGKPMQIAIDSDAVVAVTSNATRVKYTTTTEHGSSGSPCFSADWDLVALHHAGDPKYAALGLKPEFNQGIPINTIWNWMRAHQLDTLLGT